MSEATILMSVCKKPKAVPLQPKTKPLSVSRQSGKRRKPKGKNETTIKTIMNIFQRFKERRAQRRKLREWRNLAQVYGTLELFADKGLLEWNAKLRQLYIDSNLALLMMRDVDSWQHFIGGIYTWLYGRECNRAWDEFMDKEGLKAVREYMARMPKGKTLSRQDIDRIREARRMEIAQSDMEPPKIEPFEFFIIAPPDLQHSRDGSAVNAGLSQTEPSPKPTANSPVGQLISVGHYDPATDRMEMALWSDVAPLLKNTAAQ